MTYYLLKPCRTATAFISTLKKPGRVDLSAAAERLRSQGRQVSDVKVMLIVEGDPELTLYESGKILVKTDDEQLARETIDRVYDAIGLAAPLAAG
jgi:ArsR family metal-binding transcriptional regulator